MVKLEGGGFVCERRAWERVRGEEQNISFLVVARAAALRRVERRPAALGRTALIAP